MSLADIRVYYGVPAYRGARVEYQEVGTSRHCRTWRGTITASDGPYLRIRRDGDTRGMPWGYHPTWGLTYLDEPPNPGQTVEVLR